MVVVVEPFHASEFFLHRLFVWPCFALLPPFPFSLLLFVSSSSLSWQGLWCSHGWRGRTPGVSQSGVGSGHGQDVTRAGQGPGLGWESWFCWNQGPPGGLFPPTAPCFDNPESQGLPDPVLPWQSARVPSCCVLLSHPPAPLHGFGTVSCLVLAGATSPLES